MFILCLLFWSLFGSYFEYNIKLWLIDAGLILSELNNKRY